MRPHKKAFAKTINVRSFTVAVVTKKNTFERNCSGTISSVPFFSGVHQLLNDKMSPIYSRSCMQLTGRCLPNQNLDEIPSLSD